MEATPAIALDGVVRRFDDVTALDGLDLDVQRGEVVGLLGHNGAGKTTTVRTVAGLLPPDVGTVRVMGQDPAAEGAAVRQRLGVLPARPIVDDRLTATDNLRFAADVFGVPPGEVTERVERVLSRFELSDRRDERVAGFSTGMRQRLSLARVLMSDPSVLLLDEPTSALDPIAARDVRDLLADLARNGRRTVVLCTHDLTEAERLCDRVVVLERGRVVAAGTPSELAEAHGQTGLWVEVPPDLVPRACTVVEGVTGVVPDQQSTGLHVRPLVRDEVPLIVRALVEAGIEVLEARRSRPTLEDVYLALHARDWEPPSMPPTTANSGESS